MSTLAAKKAHTWERDPLDWYVEPESVTEALLTVEKIKGPVIDPCCGGGNIVNALSRAGIEAYGTDVKCYLGDRPPAWWLGQVDFLTGELPFPPRAIVMNPPFFRAKGAESFIRQALSVAADRFVAAFVDIRFLAGDDRADGLYRACPPTRIWTITPRVSCPPGEYLRAGNKAGNGSSDWCWLVWDGWRHRGTQFGWLRRAA